MYKYQRQNTARDPHRLALSSLSASFFKMDSTISPDFAAAIFLCKRKEKKRKEKKRKEKKRKEKKRKEKKRKEK
jgi:hypothetical protein